LHSWKKTVRIFIFHAQFPVKSARFLHSTHLWPEIIKFCKVLIFLGAECDWCQPFLIMCVARSTPRDAWLPAGRQKMPGCPGRRPKMPGCPGRRPKMPGCPGRRPKMNGYQQDARGYLAARREPENAWLPAGRLRMHGCPQGARGCLAARRAPEDAWLLAGQPNLPGY
jgi:hypothetical protein